MSDDVDLGAALGASADESIQRLTLYLPTRDRSGIPFDVSPWLEEAVALLARIGGGSTVMAPASGAWLDPASGYLVREQVILVYTFIRPDPFIELLPELRRFLHRLGRETNQGEVVCEFEGRLFRIDTYDP